MLHRVKPCWMALGLVLLLVAVLARPGWHLIRNWWADVDEREPLLAGYLDDASRLNRTAVHEVVAPAGDLESVLPPLLERARSEGLRVSIAGARHSMGGHTLYPGGLVVDTTGWKAMSLDEERGLLTVQAGACWSDVIAYLDPMGWSVAVMQSNHSFTVGGSLSANGHGWAFGQPPIASTVESLRLVLADGSVRRCSREENQELFSLVLGGYGLFGIILDAQLRVVPNRVYRREQRLVQLEQAMTTWEELIRDRSQIDMMYARLQVEPERLFDHVMLTLYAREEGAELPPLSAPEFTGLRRTVFRGSVGSDYGKRLRWTAETRLEPHIAAAWVARNQLLNEPVTVFENRASDTTDVLHEYFVPWHQVASFVETMRSTLRDYPLDLLNVTIRYVDEDADSFLRYADQPMVAFVLLLVQPMTDEGEEAMQVLTRQLIDHALAHEGRYYVPYRLHATPEQFVQAYPMAPEFFRLKRHYDPDELFQNAFYQRYGASAP